MVGGGASGVGFKASGFLPSAQERVGSANLAPEGPVRLHSRFLGGKQHPFDAYA